ncbi:MAG: crossover junction endodeoxyribonuclease RuvC [Clostridiales bacterium]|nr:crossover junction endodeoxyribonuclease RuvC [Clostridiales bacterium]
MIIVGVDPGFAIVGYGAVKYEGSKFTTLGYGSITTSPATPFPERLLKIHESLSEELARYRPDSVAVEQLYFNNNAKTAIMVAQGRGAALLAAARLRIPIAEYTPLQVKMAVTGYGRGDKGQVQQMVKTILGLAETPKPDDVADALAVAICHAHSRLMGSYA